MTGMGDSAFPAHVDVRVRQADLGRTGSASTIGTARWLEDARIRIRLRRFEQLVGTGGFDPFQIFLVSQRVERLAPAGSATSRVQVHTGVRRIGRSSFTYEQAVLVEGIRVASGEATIVLNGAAGPLELPDELIADLTDLQLPERDRTEVPPAGSERRRREHYPYLAPLRARIDDVDINQHVNYIAVLSWYDEAVTAFATAATGERGPVPDVAPWSYRIQYIGELTYPGDYEIGVQAVAFDDEHVHYELGVFRGSTCLGLADAIGARGELPAPEVAPALPARHQ